MSLPCAVAPTQAIGDGAEDGVACELHAKWKGKLYTLEVNSHQTLGALKQQLQDVTRVQAKRQKLVGIKLLAKSAGKPTDAHRISDLKFKKSTFMLIGNAEEDIFVDPELSDCPDVLDDLDYDYRVEEEEEEDPMHNETHMAKFRKYEKRLKINFINKPRKGKKLLVLDLDYTLFDMKSKADNYTDLKRPFTDEFLTALFPFYDIVVWSQTSWRWLEIKLTELGLLTHQDYSISFVLDKSCMFSVESKRKGTTRKHQVKSLELIWAKLPQFSAANTIHIDDLARNFAMNPRSGLKIEPYKNAFTARHTDKELVFLERYLRLMVEEDDLSAVDHSKWKEYLTANIHKLAPS